MAEKKHKVKIDIVTDNSIKEYPLIKSDKSTQLEQSRINNAGEWITHKYDMRGLATLVENSSILPQCIRAYKNNIAGYGIGVRYSEDAEETTEMSAEFTMANEIIELLNTECDTKKIFEDIIEARETYGIAYLEVIRNLAGDVAQIEFIKETPSVTKTRPLEPYVATTYYHHGRETERMKRFCKYKQQIGGETVYFREFGDPRIMDRRSGEYLEEGQSLEISFQANEILEFAIGTEPYGTVRWIGQVLGVDGSRKAEMLNNNYFENGRHTPLLIMIKGGTLTDESFDKLQHYMNDIKGAAGQHAFIILEAESTDARTDFDDQDRPEIEVKDIANILQRDELFQSYLDNNRQRVQSAFQLPDIYVGYTRDFNRATSQTAQEVTEEQVFQPERKSLAWIINNRLLNGYRFKHVEAYFLEPKLSNPDDTYKLLTVCNNAGGLTPNKAKQIIYDALGETSENYTEDWGEIPLAYSKSQGGGGLDTSALAGQLQKQIEKAAFQNDDAIVAVMKEVKSLLKNLKNDFTFEKKESIIKGEWNEDDHPRDEKGKFTSGGGSNSAGKETSVNNSKSYYKEKRKDLNGKPFSNPTLKLSKREYAKVCSEINTNYGKYKGKTLCRHYSIDKNGSKVYTFENHGFNDYNIFRKDDG